jgi:hypothetical protein
MSKFWIRQTEIIAGGKLFRSDDLDMEFDVPFDQDDEPDIASATIYNLSESSINSIKKAQNVIINAGYKGDVGTLFLGTLQKTITRWDGVDKVTEFTIGDGAQQWLTKEIHKTYPEGITASAIIMDLTGMLGLALGKFQLKKDVTFPKGRVVDAMVKDALKKLVNECDSLLNISKQKIIIQPFGEGINTGFLLASDTGLIGSPEAFEKEEEGQTIKGFKIQMLLNHRITVNSIFQVKSKTANGTYRVVRGKHSSDFITEVEVLE